MIKIRAMAPEDVDGIQEFIKERGGLLTAHSKYLYRVLAECFSNTCFVAEDDGKIIGFVSGFISQNDPTIFFLWQYGVAESHEKSNVPMRLFSNITSTARKKGCRKLRFTMEEGSKQEEHIKKLVRFLPLVKGHLAQGVFVEDVYPDTGEEFAEILYEIPLSLSAFSKLP